MMLRHSVAKDQWMVNIVTSEKQLDVVATLAEELAGKYPNIRSVVNNITDARSGVSTGQEEVLLFGRIILWKSWGSLNSRSQQLLFPNQHPGL